MALSPTQFFKSSSIQVSKAVMVMKHESVDKDELWTLRCVDSSFLLTVLHRQSQITKKENQIYDPCLASKSSFLVYVTSEWTQATQVVESQLGFFGT